MLDFRTNLIFSAQIIMKILGSSIRICRNFVTNLCQNKLISSLYLIVHSKKVEGAAVFLGPLRGQVEDEGDPSSFQLVVVAQQVIGRLVLGIEQRQLLV